MNMVVNWILQFCNSGIRIGFGISCMGRKRPRSGLSYMVLGSCEQVGSGRRKLWKESMDTKVSTPKMSSFLLNTDLGLSVRRGDRNGKDLLYSAVLTNLCFRLLDDGVVRMGLSRSKRVEGEG